MPAIISYQDLHVWKQSMRLVTDVYCITRSFPNDERFGLTSQLRRAAVSIPSNIAEGYHRFSRKDYRRFILMAFSSCAEVETQLLLAQQLNFADALTLKTTLQQVEGIMKMLNVLSQRLKSD